MTFQPSAATNAMFGADCEFDPVTGRPFEKGSGALPKEDQAANFLRERDRAADMPKEGERCIQTNRAFEFSSGCLTKARQTAIFLSELSPAEKAARAAAAQHLADVVPAGKA
ncbi:hypothetical protein JIR23_21195 [Bradyrhizobium diazoefficiens]|nr:hypothetical protein [Bradyrhizobium diazoefficiens]QQN62117.1 hypothetical protein JIR23_21195 [Bradyrhizobium diazoefficiens]